MNRVVVEAAGFAAATVPAGGEVPVASSGTAGEFGAIEAEVAAGARALAQVAAQFTGGVAVGGDDGEACSFLAFTVADDDHAIAGVLEVVREVVGDEAFVGGGEVLEDDVSVGPGGTLGAGWITVGIGLRIVVRVVGGRTAHGMLRGRGWVAPFGRPRLRGGGRQR
mgnify:CR=1 FL=1